MRARRGFVLTVAIGALLSVAPMLSAWAGSLPDVPSRPHPEDLLDCRCERWENRYNSPTNDQDSPWTLDLDRSNGRLFRTSAVGQDYDGLEYRWTDVRASALDIEDGTEIWSWRLRDPARADKPQGAALAPDGDRLVLYLNPSDDSGEVVALNGTTGSPAWTARAESAAGTGTNPEDAIVIGPYGETVVVAGQKTYPDQGSGVWLAAYDMRTGAQHWNATWSDPHNHSANAIDVAFGPQGRRVVVLGDYDSENGIAGFVQAYDVGTGERLWSTLREEPDTWFIARRLTVDGTGRVYVGWAGPRVHVDAYDLGSGERIWEVALPPARSNLNAAVLNDMVLGPEGESLYATGYRFENGLMDYLTARITSDGDVAWIRHYDSAMQDAATAVTPSPDGSKVYVSGTAFRDFPVKTGDHHRAIAEANVVTLAYGRDGGTRWRATYDSGLVNASALLAPDPHPAPLLLDGGDAAVSAVAGSESVYVSALAWSYGSARDVTTLAYPADPGETVPLP